jgi:DNA-binding PadR family transcriptional regulator
MAVLLLLQIEPMHPYGLRQRIVEWDKDRVINVSQRNAIYQTIERLERTGLLKLRERAQQERRPDRQIYETTEDGAALAQRWIVEMLSTPEPEYPAFPAALAFIKSVDRSTATAALERRAGRLVQQIERLDAQVKAALEQFPGQVDRIYLLEIEYLSAMWHAELRWVQDITEEMRIGAIGKEELAEEASATEKYGELPVH